MDEEEDGDAQLQRAEGLMRMQEQVVEKVKEEARAEAMERIYGTHC